MQCFENFGGGANAPLVARLFGFINPYKLFIKENVRNHSYPLFLSRFVEERFN